jgi:type II secretory pathway pseudopilin PulG
MNKKIALSIVLIAIIALALATWFVHNQISDLQNQISKLQNQNNELQNQISELQNQLIELENIDTARDVKITDFDWIGGYHSLGQVNLFQKFKATIKNMGNNNANGLSLSVKLLSVGTNAKIDEYTKQIDIICAGQIVEISGFVSVGVITLTLGDVLLDQWIQNLEGSF